MQTPIFEEKKKRKIRRKKQGWLQKTRKVGVDGQQVKEEKEKEEDDKQVKFSEVAVEVKDPVMDNLVSPSMESVQSKRSGERVKNSCWEQFLNNSAPHNVRLPYSCKKCKEGQIRGHWTPMGIFFVFFVPCFGFLCCMAFRDYRCDKCDTTYDFPLPKTK